MEDTHHGIFYRTPGKPAKRGLPTPPAQAFAPTQTSGEQQQNAAKGEGKFLIVQREKAATSVQLDYPELERGLHLPAVAPQKCPKPSHQLLESKRFHQLVIGTTVKSDDPARPANSPAWTPWPIGVAACWPSPEQDKALT